MRKLPEARQRAPKKVATKSPYPFDKYDLYVKAVQSPEGDVAFFQKVYKEIRRGRAPRVMREDFCGTGILSVEWVKANRKHIAYGLDLDTEPLEYGKKRYVDTLPEEKRERVHLMKRNVLSKGQPKADVSVALNFSYFLFKTRPLMKAYLKNVRDGLKPGGIAIFDSFGGSQCQDYIEDVNRQPGFTYYWEQLGFNSITNEAKFNINFKFKGKKYKKVFTYDWRMWGLPEMRELMEEVGFKKTHIYWEGTSKDGGGSGRFNRTEKGEPCLSWICYIVAEK